MHQKEIHMNKFNGRCERLVYWKLQNIKERNTSKWKDIACTWIGKINIFKYSYHPKQVHIQCNLYQNSNDILYRNRTILKFL